MFGIGFWELMVIAGVALLVIGPKQAVSLMHTFGRFAGNASAYWRRLRQEIEDIGKEDK